jgi:hypothetical protein
MRTYKPLILTFIAITLLLSTTANLAVSQDDEQSDLTIGMAEAYTPNVALKDDYRCFLIDLGLEQDTFVTRYEITPGQDLVHHIILFTGGPNTVNEAIGKDNSDPGPGWTCFGDSGVSGVGGLANALGTWVPGLSQNTYPEGTGRFLAAGTHVIMQIHYNVFGLDSAPPDLTTIDLYFGEEDQELERLRGMTLLAPVEVRCPGPYPKDIEDRCHRNYALNQVQDQSTAGFLHRLCDTNFNQYIERDIGFGERQVTQCDTLIRRDGLAMGADNHMHLRGSSIKIELNPDTPDAQVILDNPNWNFNFQQGIWFDEPVQLNAGDIVRLTCVYDNSSAIPGPDGNPLEPRYIVWGEGTTDEMCLGGITWINN